MQDPESAASSGAPSFLLRLPSDEGLVFNFTFAIRQTTSPAPAPPTSGGPVDTAVNGLTYVFASNTRELDNLVTREFHADPNLHKNPNVELVGDFGTGGMASVQESWSWRWKAPKPIEDREGGWRTVCSVRHSVSPRRSTLVHIQGLRRTNWLV